MVFENSHHHHWWNGTCSTIGSDGFSMVFPILRTNGSWWLRDKMRIDENLSETKHGMKSTSTQVDINQSTSCSRHCKKIFLIFQKLSLVCLISASARHKGRKFTTIAKNQWFFKEGKTSFEKMSWFEYWKHAFLKVIRMSSKVLYQHCMLSRYVGIVFWMQKIQRNSSNGQFHCFHYVRKRAPCWNDLFLMETRETKTHFSQCFSPVWPKRGIPWES